MLRPASLLALCLALSAPVALAQGIRMNTLEPVDLRVHVMFNNEHQTPEHVRVQLLTPGLIPVSERYTDSLGYVEFSSLRPAGYKLKISSMQVKEFTTEQFNIESMEKVHTETVYVQHEDDKSENGAIAVPAGKTLSLNTANIPDNAQKAFKKGTDSMDRNNLPDAMKYFQDAIKIYPNYSSAYNNVGVIYMKNGDLAHGREAFAKAVSLDEHDAQACLNYGKVVLDEKNYPQAEQLLGKSLAADPSQPEALVLIARAQYMQSKFDDAILNARRVHAMPHERFAVAHLLAGKALESKKQYAQAAEEYKLYLKESPQGASATQVRASLQSLESQKH